MKGKNTHVRSEFTAAQLAENLVVLRNAAHLTQKSVADALGISVQAVSKWERGACCPDIAFLPVLADLFGVSIDELFGRKRVSPTENT